MGRLLPIAQAVPLVGLSEYMLRRGIRERRFPCIRTGLGYGKIYVDIDLLEQVLEREARAHIVTDTSDNLTEYGQLRVVKE